MDLNDLQDTLSACMVKDRFGLTQGFTRIKKSVKDKNIDDESLEKQLISWQKKVNTSQALFEMRRALPVKIDYPDLPVSDKRDDIKALIEANQVVIIAGETGSGKTTQLPKMCLELGRGRAGMIAHTQPRRLAARSVASRIAQELDDQVGNLVGCKIRFSEQVSNSTFVKLLTDGMLLAEIQQDKFLNQYDTIIIDEAHERSLNIDFLLGYLKRVLPKRPDLKVIITSATIDPQRFSKHFDNAPVIEVSGRSYDVEIRHHNYIEDSRAQDQIESISLAVDELFAEGRGDILVFLSSEREIRETQQALQKRQLRNTEVIPLYARLSASDQQRIFHPQGQRRIVLSTNVAETSLTVPGIKYVIDTGLVRMSRYSHRLKVQRLPIEPISQASAKQRAGRCGRTSAGVCIRLFSEDDFLSRPEFTDPEITRTHLSSVILKMLSLGLGEISDFAFIQAPQDKFITDGVRLLEELQAIEKLKGRLRLTSIGRKMAKLPLDPKYARMLLAAKEQDCVSEVMIITAGLSVQDPRERPHDKQQKADEAHQIFADKNSDLISLLNVYQSFKTEQKELSQNQLRKWCVKHFIHYQRMREWQDIVHQIKHMLVSIDLRINSDEAAYEAIHSAISIGLLGQLGLKETNGFYLGARNSQFKIFPGSSVFKAQPKWIIAAELVETSSLFARQVARIDIEWIEKQAEHLLKRNYVEVHWSKKRGAVMAYMNALLFGLPIVSRRVVNYSNINQTESRLLFIRHALVEGDTKLNYAFLRQNQSLIEDVQSLEKKTRRRDILVDEEELVEFYNSRLAEHVCSESSFKKWWQKASQVQSDMLNFERHQLLKRDASDITEQSFPDVWQQHNLLFPLEYEFEPNQEYVGVCIFIPIEQLNQVQDVGFDWLVPGLRHELVVALIKSLPKRLRRNFVPAPDYATACLADMPTVDKKGNALNMVDALANKLFRMSGSQVANDDFNVEALPSHLRMNFAVINNHTSQTQSSNNKQTGSKRNILGRDKSLNSLKQTFQGQLSKSLQKVASSGIEKENLHTFSIEDLPKVYSQKQNGVEIKAFPALEDAGKQVNVKLFTSEQEASSQHRLGIIKLIKTNVPSPVKYLQEKLPNKAKLSLYFNPFGQVSLLIADIIDAAVDDLLIELGGSDNIRSKEAYNAAQEHVRMELNDRALNIAKQVEVGLSVANQVQKYCKGSIPLNMVNHISHIKEHLSVLVFKGFVFYYGSTQLADWNRYLKGLLQRCEKLKVDPNRDRLNQIEIDKANDIVSTLREDLKKRQRDTTALTELSQMIEEFRISLFAQQIGTKFPISLKRIRNKVQDISINS